ncbi:MAG: DUF2460 domain-containing protein [Bosea sp.]|jgi:uncharacterized protein (TIGR02217 family)|nr:DUF2460 domain-containing protein [Bosea sp. (in: a-proteobacteria)]
MSFADFHEVRFPIEISRGARGGPARRTDIVTLASGREHRNARWQHSRRRFDAGYGVRTLAALAEVVAFFEERRGRLIGFRWRDPLDWTSAPGNAPPTALDQPIGQGDGVRTAFQLVKRYGGAHAPYERPIVKPVAGTVRLAVGDAPLASSAFAVDAASGVVTLAAPPPAGAALLAGFEFDVPVRFDIDELDVELSAFDAGAIPSIPLVELVL